MRFCPYCGAELLKEGAAFCVECGARINTPEGERESSRRKQESSRNRKSEHPRQKRTRPAEGKRKEEPEKRRQQRKSDNRDKRRPVRRYKLDQVDDYDGYYDDIIPSDKGNRREEIDRNLIKKIGGLILGVLIIVTLCLIMMYAV